MGSWVREESMSSLTTLIRLLIESENIDKIKALGADRAEFFEKYIS